MNTFDSWYRSIHPVILGEIEYMLVKKVVNELEAENAELKAALLEVTGNFAIQGRKLAILEQEKEQWKSQAEANAAGYNQAVDEINKLRAENGLLRNALAAWMESYNIMVDKTTGILRDSIRGFFLDCPWKTKEALREDTK